MSGRREAAEYVRKVFRVKRMTPSKSKDFAMWYYDTANFPS
jgi:hypothetical protein